MLAQLARQRRGLQQLLPVASSCAVLQELLPVASSCGALQQSRGASMKIFEIFSKEGREERRKKLKEEMERGYFDDFRDFRDKKGKIFMAPERLIPASQAAFFPAIQALRPDGSPAVFPPSAASSRNEGSSSSEGSSEGSSSPAGSFGPILVCIAFRAGAQEMLEAWAVPFGEHFKGRPGVSICELSLVESAVMSVWPFKQAILRGGSSRRDKYALPLHYLFRFGDTQELREVLLMTNRLTGYIYLVDSQGRVRWRGSGSPDQAELQSLMRCSEELLSQRPASNGGNSGRASGDPAAKPPT